MKQKIDTKHRKKRGNGRAARRRRARRIAAAIIALCAVAAGLMARSAVPSLAALMWGIAAGVFLALSALLMLRKALPAALYLLLGVIGLALLVTGGLGRDYVKHDGQYVPQEILVTELRVTDAYPGNLMRMERLERLDMVDSTVTDFSPLEALRSLRRLDVRGNYAFTRSDYDRLAQALPNCEILWSMPVGDEYVDSNVTEINLAGSGMDAGEIQAVMDAHPDVAVTYDVALMGRSIAPDAQALDLRGEAIDIDAINDALTLLPAVQTIDLRGEPATAETIAALTAAHPNIRFMFTCDVPGGAMTTEDEEVTVPGGGLAELSSYMAFIDYMPNLRTMDARAVQLSESDIAQLQADPRSHKLIYGFTAFGRTLSTLDTEVNLDGVAMTDVAEVERMVNAMPNLQRVSMVNCGLSDEQMSGLCDRHPDVRFIWIIHFGKYTLRTDATAFTTNLYAVNPYHYTSGTFAMLRYCKDLMYLDIGHCELTSIEGLAGLTKLRVLILADNNITDISPLAGLQDLEYVEIFLNKVSDLTPLANKTKLKDLNIYYNPAITDLTPLESCTALERVWLGHCGFSDAKLSRLRKALPNAKVYAGSGGSTDGGWRSHKRYKVIKQMNKTGQYVPFD